jgi:hypothetical protein
MPWNDWQFWVVTACTLAAAGYLLRGVLPMVSRRARQRRNERRASLTISAKPTHGDHPQH